MGAPKLSWHDKQSFVPRLPPLTKPRPLQGGEIPSLFPVKSLNDPMSGDSVPEWPRGEEPGPAVSLVHSAPKCVCVGWGGGTLSRPSMPFLLTAAVRDLPALSPSASKHNGLWALGTSFIPLRPWFFWDGKGFR